MAIFNFTNQDYECTIILKNGINEVTLGAPAIKELVIKENIFNWYSTGYIVLDNTYLNMFRKSVMPEKMQKKEETKQAETKMFYKFRSDGRDTLIISIKPSLTSTEGKTDFIDINKWSIELECSIYDFDEPNDISEKKELKLYFHDKMFQMMIEKNMEFSTAKKAIQNNGVDIYSANNNQRSLRTGEAISELIKDAGFEKHCQKVEDTLFWNMGDDKNTVFYTSPANSRVIQDLNYFLDIHCGDESTGFDPCIFKLERPEKSGEPRQFTLIPLSEYFAKAGNNIDEEPKEYQIEFFNIQTFADTDSTSVKNKTKIPTKPNVALKQNFSTTGYNTISNYSFFEMSPIHATTDITNYLLVNYNMTNKQFNIQQDRLEDAEKHIIEKYLVNVVCQDNAMVFPVNNYAKQGHNTTVKYTLNFTESARKSEGRNKIILASLFKNMAISFDTTGATIRQPGRFFGVRYTKNENEQDYDNRIEGQYFATEVNHIFRPTQKQYVNEIVGVKMHLFKKDEYEIPYDSDVENIA